MKQICSKKKKISKQINNVNYVDEKYTKIIKNLKGEKLPIHNIK